MQPAKFRFADGCFGVAWAIVGVALVALVVLVLQPVWSAKSDLADRFLIPLASVWLVYRAWPRFSAERVAPNWLGFPILAIAAAAFALGWFFVVQVSGRPIVVWWLTLSFLAMVFGLALLHVGWRRASWLIFPLVFSLFSLPTPGRIYNPLENRLKNFTTSAAETVLPIIGVPVTREPGSYELVLKSGVLGVVEACSGVRSITALTAIAVLVAFLRRFGPIRWIILLVLTYGVVAISNSLRVIATGLLQEFVGRWATMGLPHEILGVVVILVGLALILGLSSLIAAKKPTVEPEPGPAIPVRLDRPILALLSLLVLVPAFGVCLSCERYREDFRVFVKLEELSDRLGEWTGSRRDVPDVIRDELQCDQVVCNSYRNALGQEIVVYVMFWANSAATADRHHPDICYPFRGWTVTRSNVGPIVLPHGVEIPVSVRHYVRPGEQQILFFWTQHGNNILPDGVAGPELMSGHSWIVKMLKEGHVPVDRGARVSVLIGAQTRGSMETGEKMLRGFGRDFATDLYRVAPWAKPVKSVGDAK